MSATLRGLTAWSEPGIAVVMGTSDIASAIGWHLQQAGLPVLLLRDTGSPVLRGAMAFDDALELGMATLEGVTARAQIWRGQLPEPREPLVSRDNLAVALAAFRPGAVAVVVDARLRKYAEAEDLRPLAALTIGVGPGFVAGGNVLLAVESLPGDEGRVIAEGPTETATGKAVPLGGAGSERFVYTPLAGPWLPMCELGDVVLEGDVLGHLGDTEIAAPIGGRIRGLVRPRAGMPRGVKLAEINPKIEDRWNGIPPRADRIGRGVVAALDVQVSGTRKLSICASAALIDQ